MKSLSAMNLLLISTNSVATRQETKYMLADHNRQQDSTNRSLDLEDQHLDLIYQKDTALRYLRGNVSIMFAVERCSLCGGTARMSWQWECISTFLAPGPHIVCFFHLVARYEHPVLRK